MYKNGLGIRYPTMFDMPQNQTNQTKPTILPVW